MVSCIKPFYLELHMILSFAPGRPFLVALMLYNGNRWNIIYFFFSYMGIFTARPCLALLPFGLGSGLLSSMKTVER